MKRNRSIEEGRGVRPPGWNEEEQYEHSDDEEYPPARKLLKNLLENEVDRALHELNQETLPLSHFKGHRAASLIPEFDPDGEDCTVSTWTKKIDLLGDIHGWTDKVKAFHLQDKLRGQARKWYNRLDEYNYSWHEWKDMLMRAFPKHRDYSALLDEMMQRKKLPNETMTKYYQDKIAMCFRCNLSDAASVSCIIRGLPTSLQPNARAFQCQRPDELYEAFLCALDDYRTPTFEPRAPNKDTKQLSMPDKKVNLETDPCPRCKKKTSHMLRNCTIPDQRICFKCGIQGHIATRCTRASSTHIKALAEPNSNVKEIKLLQNYNEIYKKMVKLNGIYLKSYIDTGSQVNVINSQIVRVLGLNVTPTSTMLKGFSGGILTSRGEVQFTLEIDDIKVRCTAHVTDSDMQDIQLLIGQPIINADRVSLVVINGTTTLRLDPDPSTEFNVAEEVQKFKVVTSSKESLPPGTSIIKVQLQGNPEGNDVCTAPRHYELQGVSYSLPATLLRGSEGYIKVVNTGAENVNWRAGEVLTRAESCIEPGGRPSQMARYKKTGFMDDDAGSVSSIQLNEGVRSGGTHIRYHMGVSFIGWHQRTRLERILLVATAVLLAAVLLTITLLLTIRGSPTDLPVPPCYQPEKPELDVCLKGSCIYTASEVIRALDETQDPCTDFYEFACGGWIKNNPIPEGKSSWGIFSKIELQNQLIIRYALEKVNISNTGDAEAKARIYYDACIDTNETIESLGEKPLVAVINDLGGWHIVPNTTTKQPWNLQKLVQDVQNKYNLGGLFNWAVTEDDRNSSKHVIVLDQGGLNLPTRDNYLNRTAHKKVLDAYLDFMTRICVLLGANKSEARVQMNKVMLFETELANITTPSEDRRDEEGLYNPYTIETWQKEVPFLNWTLFFNDAFKLVNKTIPSTQRIVVYAPEYFKNLTKVIEKFSKTEDNRRTVTSYMMWQVSRALSTYLSKSFRDATKILRKALFGSEGTEESWRYCVTDTNNAIGFAVGAMFVREVFHGEAKTQGEIMINNIRNAFKRNLKNLNWMDSETRRAAEVKADAITDMIGFPDYILHKDELDKQYEELDVKPNEYFANNIAYNMFSLKNDLKKLDKPVNKTKWGMTPSTVNAYYTPTKNQIVFPAGILQLPFYDGDNPKCVNYGAMGVVMGHELTHAFDDQGREYDRFGNLNQWWNNNTIKNFKKRAACMQEQYAKYSVDGQKLNGKQTLGENIADNGGLKASFHAYRHYRNNSKENLTLPGLNYTDGQLFFISFAQVWCQAMTKESTKMQIEKDDHTIAKYRVIGPLTNLREFSEEFQCKPGSKMNPTHKCEVW